MLLLGNVAVAQTQAPPQTPMENFAFRLYAEGCVRFIAQPDPLEAFLKSRFLTPAAADVAARYLRGEAGSVWVLRNYEGITVVSQFEGKVCSVWVRHGTSEILRGYFLRLMEGKSGDDAPRREKFEDREIAGPAGPMRYLAYRTLVPSPQAQDIYIVSSVLIGPEPGGATLTVLASGIARGNLQPK